MVIPLISVLSTSPAGMSMFHDKVLCVQPTLLIDSLLFQKLRTIGNIFIANLALADLFVSGLVNPLAIVGMLYNRFKLISL